MRVDRQRCKRCGRFFASPNPYDEFCPSPRSCAVDDKDERERWQRRSDENLKALEAMRDRP